MEKLTSEQLKRCICVTGLLLAMSGPVMGQISHKPLNKHDQLKRKSLKEASQTEADYKDTHLNMDAYSFKKGGAAGWDGLFPLLLLRPVDAPDKEAVQRNPANKERKFRLFRKKKKVN
jgi:hypothetical protein